ncbi:MAG: ATP-binding protein [Oscillospiraceae bacterium]|nr:ATP-binding protein [Oscillospiraceae bacterium]
MLMHIIEKNDDCSKEGVYMVLRKIYLERLKKWREKQLIKVISGVRRCGKSTLLAQYIDYLLSEGIGNEQIVSVNLEDVEYEHLLNYKALYDYIKERLCKDRYTYVFIDEIQQCSSFEKAVDSLFIKDKVDVYITGSNAYLLSGELATLLSGRYIEINMLPLSFLEHMDFLNWEDSFLPAYLPMPLGPNLRAEFDIYLRYGSFPYVSQLERDDAVIKTYIDGIYSTILIKDVAMREGISDISVLEGVVKFLCNNIGSPVSIKKVSDTINSSGRNISVNTVEKYVRALTDSFIFYKADRFDIKGRQHLKTLGKYYLVDTGLRNMLLSGSSPDLGHQLENIVYLELLRRGNRVNIGKLAEKEVDFVSNNVDGICYYQVAATVMDENTLDRELAPLRKIPDHHPKYLLTLDDIITNANHDGIRQINVLNWLLFNNDAG